jgi:hypothetical protein
MRKLLLSVLATIALVAGDAVATGADVGPLLRETQFSRSENKNFLIIWWIPDEFWELSLKDNPATPAPVQKEILDAVHHYLVFAVVEGTIGALGQIEAVPKEAVLAKMSVTVVEHVLKPIPDDNLDEGAKNLFQAMKPFISSAAGKIGQSMEFVLFEGFDTKGKRYVDPRKKGSLSAKLGEREFTWRLPLGALMPPKYDADSGEEFPGNYDFSPFSGAKLSTDKPAQK